MRNRLFIFLMFLAVVCTMASPRMSRGNYRFYAGDDSIAIDSTKPLLIDSTKSLLLDSIAKPKSMDDSIAAMIAAHNKAIDDSIRLDSLNRKKANGIDAPVEFEAKDSMVYFAGSKNAFFYGNSNVKYENMDLKSDRVSLSMDSSLVRATPSVDSLGNKIGMPVFKMGSEEYESDTMAFNFKTKKGFINDVYTAQEDGFLTAKISKRDSTGVMYLAKGRYTTCDEDHPDFYIALSRAKVRPGKDVVFGPAYLVVADVPLPLAIPYGFFPFSKSYSSGFIMPTYGDENARGFYLRDGGYYFAISDKMDLKLIGEIYTKGSWGVSAASNYKKRYKYSGSLLFSYQNTKNGEKGMPDFMEQNSFKLQWSHRQDSKANPFSTLSASINFATSSYEKNNLTSMYNPQTMTQSLRTSSVSWNTSFSSLGMTLSSTANLAQNMRDTTLAITLPDLNINISRFYPFKRKHAVGNERWYEKISMSYTGHISNSITAKESEFFKSGFMKLMKNGMQHSIPISGTFNVLKYINVSPSVSITGRTYTQRNKRHWDVEQQKAVEEETEYGVYNMFGWNASVSANTKLYGFYTPNRKIFGDKILMVRHVMTPRVSFSYAPDTKNHFYSGYDSYLVYDEEGRPKFDTSGNQVREYYSPYSSGIFGVPSVYKSGSFNFDLSNNIEMKVKSETDSIGYKKVSIIDELGASMTYNPLAETRKWSDLNMRIRLKLTKSYTFNLNAIFATYAYIMQNGRPVISDKTEYSFKRFGRFQGMSQNLSYTLNPQKLRELFTGEKKKKKDSSNDDEYDTGVNTNVDDVMEKGKHAAESQSSMAETDEDGYLLFSMPWSLTFGYGISMREDLSNNYKERPDGTVSFGYRFTQTLNMSGNIQLSKGWNINFSSGYDFDMKRLSMTTASLSRDLHCFSMSASIVLAPYTSYNFSFRCNAATLTDALKYDKRSGSTNIIQWY